MDYKDENNLFVETINVNNKKITIERNHVKDEEYEKRIVQVKLDPHFAILSLKKNFDEENTEKTIEILDNFTTFAKLFKIPIYKEFLELDIPAILIECISLEMPHDLALASLKFIDTLFRTQSKDLYRALLENGLVEALCSIMESIENTDIIFVYSILMTIASIKTEGKEMLLERIPWDFISGSVGSDQSVDVYIASTLHRLSQINESEDFAREFISNIGALKEKFLPESLPQLIQSVIYISDRMIDENYIAAIVDAGIISFVESLFDESSDELFKYLCIFYEKIYECGYEGQPNIDFFLGCINGDNEQRTFCSLGTLETIIEDIPDLAIPIIDSGITDQIFNILHESKVSMKFAAGSLLCTLMRYSNDDYMEFLSGTDFVEMLLDLFKMDDGYEFRTCFVINFCDALLHTSNIEVQEKILCDFSDADGCEEFEALRNDDSELPIHIDRFMHAFFDDCSESDSEDSKNEEDNDVK